MNVFFDYQIFYLQRYGGISRYFYELAAELSKIEACHPKIIVPFHANDYIQKAGKKEFIYTYGPLRKKLYYNRFYNGQIERNEAETKRLCRSVKGAILHETFYLHRQNVQNPKVTTIHDMIPELVPNQAKDKMEVIAQKKKAINEAALVIAVSESTRKDLLQVYPEVASKTFVVHHGLNTLPSPEPIGNFQSKPFLLFVGHRAGYKNFETLLEVYCADPQLRFDFDLICFGGSEMTPREEMLINKNNVGNRVKFVTGPDSMLSALYRSAAALVYLSSYEGFGMPVLEAMSLSCPVLGANTSSIPEVAGDAAFLVDPANKQEISKGLSTLLFDFEKRENFIEAGKKRANLFSWEKCARETLDLYKRLL